jgi:hypothetical protein
VYLLHRAVPTVDIIKLHIVVVNPQTCYRVRVIAGEVDHFANHNTLHREDERFLFVAGKDGYLFLEMPQLRCVVGGPQAYFRLRSNRGVGISGRGATASGADTAYRGWPVIVVEHLKFGRGRLPIDHLPQVYHRLGCSQLLC